MIKSVLRLQYLFCSGISSIWKFQSCSDFSFYWLFLNSEGDALLQCTAYDYFEAEWDHLHSHLRDVLWHDIFQLSTSTATTEYCEWLQVELMYVSLIKRNQVMDHSSSCFSAFCAGAMNHRSHFFHLYLLPLFDGPEMLSCASDEAKLFAENVFKKHNFDDLGIQRCSHEFFTETIELLSRKQISVILSLLEFTPWKTEQLLWRMELQEKESQIYQSIQEIYLERSNR